MTKGKLATTRSDHCAIIESYNCGVPVDELCEKYNLKRATINRIIKNYEQSGLSLVIKARQYSNRSKLTRDQLSKVLCYYSSSSKSYSDVVKFIYCMFGVTVSKTSISHYLHRARSFLARSEQDSESTNSSQPPEDDEVQDLTLTESSESSPPTVGDEGSPVTNFMETSMMIPDETESEFSFYF